MQEHSSPVTVEDLEALASLVWEPGFLASPVPITLLFPPTQADGFPFN